MKKLISILFLSAVMTSGLVSCLDMGNGGNSSTFTTPAVVWFNMSKGGSTLLTSAGEFGAPGLATSNFQPGDCGIARLTLDMDNQPSQEYYTATNIEYAPVDQSIVDIRDTAIIADYFPVDSIFPIKEMSILDYHPILKGKFFLGIAHSTSIRQKITYKMIAIQKDVPSNQATDVYLVAKKGEASNENKSDIYAFDILNTISTLGKDTIIKSSSVDYPVKLLTVKLQYCSEVKDGKPVYTEYKPSSTPIQLAIYTN